MARYKKHGMYGSPEYVTWIEMRRRCSDDSRHNYHLYGGKGITVCPQWNEFAAFFADMGRKPSSLHTIERKDGNGNYEPTNCIWATPTAQANNRATNRHVRYRRRSMTLAQALRMAGSVVRKDTARYRLNTGWPVARAVETPPDARFSHPLT